jgi:hypothetical protein
MFTAGTLPKPPSAGSLSGGACGHGDLKSLLWTRRQAAGVEDGVLAGELDVPEPDDDPESDEDVDPVDEDPEPVDEVLGESDDELDEVLSDDELEPPSPFLSEPLDPLAPESRESVR